MGGPLSFSWLLTLQVEQVRGAKVEGPHSGMSRERRHVQWLELELRV